MAQLMEARVAQAAASSALVERGAVLGQVTAERALASQQLCEAEARLSLLEAEAAGAKAQAAEAAAQAFAAQSNTLTPQQVCSKSAPHQMISWQ